VNPAHGHPSFGHMLPMAIYLTIDLERTFPYLRDLKSEKRIQKGDTRKSEGSKGQKC